MAAAARMKPWEVGEEIEIGKVDLQTHQTQWHPAIVSKVFPLTVLYADGSSEVLPIGAFRRRPEKRDDGDQAPKIELPAEVLKEIYHKALVAIIHEGSTNTPNATVKRMLNLAKEAIGEVPI